MTTTNAAAATIPQATPAAQQFRKGVVKQVILKENLF